MTAQAVDPLPLYRDFPVPSLAVQICLVDFYRAGEVGLKHFFLILIRLGLGQPCL
jgi:hypothetical protein